MQTCERLLVLNASSDSLLSKVYSLKRACPRLLDPHPPRACAALVKRFPEHPRGLMLDKGDKNGAEALRASAPKVLLALQPWYTVLVDFVLFHDHAIKLLTETSATVTDFSARRNPVVLHGFMNLLCGLVKLHLLCAQLPCKLLVQLYALCVFNYGGTDHPLHARLVGFIDTYEVPVPQLQVQLQICATRISEVLESVAAPPLLLFSTTVRRLRTDNLLCPYASPNQQQQQPPNSKDNHSGPTTVADSPVYDDLAHLSSYKAWVLFGVLACPGALALAPSHTTALKAALSDGILVSLWRDEVICVHEEYALHVHSHLANLAAHLKKESKHTDNKQQQHQIHQQHVVGAVLDHKATKHLVHDAYDAAVKQSGGLHRERRTLLRQEMKRLVGYFAEQPGVIAPKLPLALAALALVKDEVEWCVRHAAGVSQGQQRARASGAKLPPVQPKPQDFHDPLLGELMVDSDALSQLILKYKRVVQQYSVNRLSLLSRSLASFLQPPAAAGDIGGGGTALLNGVAGELERAVAGEGSAESMKALRLDCARLAALALSSKVSLALRAHCASSSVSAGLPDACAALASVASWARYVDEFAEVVAERASLAGLFEYRHHVLKMQAAWAEASPSSCLAVLQVCPRNPDTLLLTEVVSFAQSSLASCAATLTRALDGLASSRAEVLTEGVSMAAAARRVITSVTATGGGKGKKGGAAAAAAGEAMATRRLPGCESRREAAVEIERLQHYLDVGIGTAAALNAASPVHIGPHVLDPRLFLLDALRSWLRLRVRDSCSSVDSAAALRGVEGRVEGLIAAARVIEAQMNVDVQQLLQEVLLSEAGSKSVDKGETAAQSIAQWCTNAVIRDAKTTLAVYSPFLNSFVHAKTGKTVLGESELAAFVRVFGPDGARVLMERITTCMRECIRDIESVVTANSTILHELSLAFQHESTRAACLKKFTDVDALTASMLVLGQCLALRRVLAAAARDGVSTLSWELLAAACVTASDNSGPKASVLQDGWHVYTQEDKDVVVAAMVSSERASGHDSKWQLLLPVAFAAVFASTAAWKHAEYNAKTQALSNNMTCLALSLPALLSACTSTSASNKDAPLGRFVRCAGAVTLGLASSNQANAGSGSGKGASHNQTLESQLCGKLAVLNQISEHHHLSPLPRAVPSALLRSVLRRATQQPHQVGGASGAGDAAIGDGEDVVRLEGRRRSSVLGAFLERRMSK